ncbi:YdiU family protein [Niveibacterium sp. 24ML]|uniref:protein adenylyltransferase SelO n=1 Tax=Niveibacterium sp. 24ML TaxID=2985512 RepID=UPI002270DBE0|nr:YdiU family protein [Niveibacterium sp. 24ML]MCX9156310.1 YdiU family protein [Niveibacterium sp. 24ML]
MTATAFRPFESLEFDNLFVRSHAADPGRANVPRQVPGAAFSHVSPTPTRAPALLAWSDPLGALLGIARPPLGEGPVAEVLGGSRVLPGMQPYAARYGGHQFGQWAGQLGDGRAITLGEILDTTGQRQELQLKGAGRTPYSRHADGRAVLRSSVREFLCSEAMHHLGIPTTRALSLVATGDGVVRDMFYDGNPQTEPGAVVCRVAPSFVRFGNFEIFAAENEATNLRTLADWVIRHHYPELGEPGPATYAAWFKEISRRTAVMVAHWMRVGFVHGVMNTDNMSILGLTIDYGPYGWLEDFDLGWTPNTTDAQGRRYCYGQQAQIAYWNLTRLAGALSELVGDDDALRAGLETYRVTFGDSWSQMLADKLGITDRGGDDEDGLITDLFGLLQQTETDMTIFFRSLTAVPLGAGVSAAEQIAPLRDAFYDPAALDGPHGGAMADWLARYAARVREDGDAAAGRIARMNAANPKYVLRNWIAQQAIDAASTGDTSQIERLLDVLRKPYDEQPEHADLFARRPDWARSKPGCSALSCSS